MRKWLLLAFCLLCMLTAGCASPSYELQFQGQRFIVSPAAGKMSDEQYAYTFTRTRVPEGTEIKVVYPDESYFWWVVPEEGSFQDGHGGWSASYEETKYQPGLTLIEVLETEVPEDKMTILVPIILLMVFGVLCAVAPESAAKMRFGRSKRPISPVTLHLYRSIGVLSIGFAVYLMIR